MLTDIFKLALVLYEEYGLRIGLSVFAFILGLSGLWKGRIKIGALLKLAWSRDKATYEIIEGALTSILWKLQADRAFLFEFRGYNRKLQPIPFRFADCTSEILNPSANIRPEKENLQGIDLSTIPFWVAELSQKGEVCISKVESIRRHDEATCQILEAQDIQSVYAVGLINFRRVPLGFLGVDYCCEEKELEEELMESLRFEALKVIGLLELSGSFVNTKDK